jgi:ABC-2 type transport system ATP-binding protein
VRQQIGYLPDRPPLYDDMRVHEYLVFAAKLRGLRGKELLERVGTVEELTELEEYRDDLIHGLSHGYRQRVGIAQAIVHRPALVVMDEPISGLDPAQIVEMRRLVRSLAGEHTVIVSSHILSEISETCDRILVLRDGRVVASGSEQELSSQLLQGMRVDVTVRKSDASDVLADARAALNTIAEVDRVDEVAQADNGALSLRVQASSDVRAFLSRALVESGFDLLELTRSARELESVFLELSGSSSRATRLGGGNGTDVSEAHDPEEDEEQ